MFVKQKQKEYKEHIDIYTLASELIIDDIVPANELRQTLIDRFRLYETKNVTFSRRKHPVYPV